MTTSQPTAISSLSGIETSVHDVFDAAAYDPYDLGFADLVPARADSAGLTSLETEISDYQASLQSPVAPTTVVEVLS